jgi:hypothetical protein
MLCIQARVPKMKHNERYDEKLMHFFFVPTRSIDLLYIHNQVQREY